MRADVLLKKARQKLADSPSSRLDAEILLAKVMGKPRSWFFAHAEALVDLDIQRRFNELVARRATGEPIAYLVGEREFWSLRLKVTPDVLIPRPETELLVELALRHLPRESSCRIADLGTGSGAIALALASELPRAYVVAVESNAAVLDLARENARLLGIGENRLDFRAGNWFEPLGNDRFDLIVSNPPYVRDDDPHLQQGDVRFEPRSALAAGPDGLDAIRVIVAETPLHLSRDGVLILEHGHDQQPAVVAEIKDAHPEASVETHSDHAGVPRAVVVRFGGQPTEANM